MIPAAVRALPRPEPRSVRALRSAAGVLAAVLAAVVTLALIPAPAAAATEDRSARSSIGLLPVDVLEAWRARAATGRLPQSPARVAGAAGASPASGPASAAPTPGASGSTVPGALLVTVSEPSDAEVVHALAQEASPARHWVDARPDAVGGFVDLADPAQGRGAPARDTAESVGLRAIADLTPYVLRVEVEPGSEAAAAQMLRTLPGVAAVEPVRTYAALRVPDDSDYPQQWAHRLSGIEAAWDVTTGGEDVDGDEVTVAIIDSGMVGSHPDLDGNITEQVTFTDGSAAVQPLGSTTEGCEGGFSHGTFVAGIIGAHGDNGIGVAGVNWQTSMLDLAVFWPQGGGCFTDDVLVILAIDYATKAGADVINLSLGSVASGCGTAMQRTIDRARVAGAVVVAAAGNHQLSPGMAGQASTPASCNGVVSVGAVDRDGNRTGYSASNRHIDLVAPGGDRSSGPDGLIISTAADGEVEGQAGTSFAAPYVSGVAALIRTVNPALTPDEVESVLERTAEDAATEGRDDQHGWGLVQAGEAVAMAEEASGDEGAVPPSEPDPPFPVGDEDDDITLPPRPPEVIRIATGELTTEAIAQAAAVSQALFADGSALHAVIARADDYADALAGSALGFGVGPLLFSPSDGPLAETTQQELRRALPTGSTVFLLGGTAALPEGLDGELQELGYEPVRLAGETREETAAVVAQKVREVVVSLDYEPLPLVILATRENWPDAVAAGSFASYFGIPVLLSQPDGELHPVTRAALEQLRPELLYVIGGPAAISDDVLDQARTAAGTAAEATVRLGGEERVGTALAVARELEGVFSDLLDSRPALAVAVNLRRADGYAHVLSATAVSGAFPSVFVPVEGDAGDVLRPAVRDYIAGYDVDGLIVGGTDLITTGVEAELLALLRER